MELVSSFEALVREVSFVMTRPTFQSFVVVLAGWLFARRRTVTGMIQPAGAVGTKHHSAFHRVFADARWSLDDLGLAVFGLVLGLLDPAATILLAVDDTLARKRGLKIFSVGMHHDPILSSRGCAVVNWGHNWVVLGVLVELPILKGRWFCLPVLLRLYRSKQTVAKDRRVNVPPGPDVLEVKVGANNEIWCLPGGDTEQTAGRNPPSRRPAGKRQNRFRLDRGLLIDKCSWNFPLIKQTSA
ncbi:MAG: transposase [Planctomycetota bacterium]|nr:transposase [Planctomycetota bacterium]